MSTNKKRKVLTLEQKVKVIKLNEKGDSHRVIVESFEVGKTQIGSIVKNKDEILKQWENGADGNRKIVKARRCLYPELNEKIFEWVSSARAKNIPITGRMIQEKAIILSTELGYDDFTASNGWLNRFQIRHNIKCSILSGESADVPTDVIEDWSKRLSDICSGYDDKNIFNCDETGYFIGLCQTGH